MIYQEANSAFVIDKFLETSYCSPANNYKGIFLDMNLAKTLKSWSILNGWQVHAVKGRMACVCVQKCHPGGCSPAVRAYSAMEADASEYPSVAQTADSSEDSFLKKNGIY